MISNDYVYGISRRIYIIKLYIGGVSNFETRISSKTFLCKAVFEREEFMTKSLDDRPDGQLRSLKPEVKKMPLEYMGKLHGFHFFKNCQKGMFGGEDVK